MHNTTMYTTVNTRYAYINTLSYIKFEKTVQKQAEYIKFERLVYETARIKVLQKIKIVKLIKQSLP